MLAVEMVCGPHADRSGRRHSAKRLYLLFFTALPVAPVRRGAACAGAGAREGTWEERRGRPVHRAGARHGCSVALSGSAPALGYAALALRSGARRGDRAGYPMRR